MEENHPTKNTAYGTKRDLSKEEIQTANKHLVSALCH